MNTTALLDTLALVDFLAARVEGQKIATSELGHAVARAAISRPGRPKGVYLLAGPTGVGKTELVKALHELLYDNAPEHLARFDMGEFKDGEAGHRRFFTDGGESEQGVLIDSLIRLNCAGGGILHLDEIEKAPHFRDALLAMFDEGRVTDRFGQTHRLDALFVIATTNLGGAATVRQPENAPYTTLRRIIESEVKVFFSPEGFNRFDSVVVFRRLTQDVQRAQCRRRAEAEAAMLSREMRYALGYELGFLPVPNTAINVILDHGYSAEMGLRPLRRAVSKLMGDAWCALRDRFGRGEVDPATIMAGGYQLAWQVVDIPIEERHGSKSPRRLALVPVDPCAAEHIHVFDDGYSKLRVISTDDVISRPIDAFAFALPKAA